MKHTSRDTAHGHGRSYLPLLAALILSGCSSSTELVNAWKDPEGLEAPMRDVLVVAIKKDVAHRRLLEDALASRLEEHGARATPSHRFFPSAVPDTQEVGTVVREKAFDGILVAAELASDVQREFTPGYTTQEPLNRYDPWAGSYQTTFVEVHHLSRMDETHLIRHRVDVWSTEGDGWLVWTAEGETMDPRSMENVGNELAGRVVPELVKNGFIPGAP